MIATDGTFASQHLMLQCGEYTSHFNETILKRVGKECLNDAANDEQAKITALLKYITENVKPDERVVVYCHYTNTPKAIANALSARNISSCIITGLTPDQDRFTLIEKFQHGDYQILLCTHCLEDSIQLTRANHVVIYSPWWQPNGAWQCIARAHRIGQTRTVYAVYIRYNIGIDTHVYNISNNKTKIVDV